MIHWRSLGAALAAISMLFWTAREGAAQSYPQRPVRFIVPAPAGGPTDVPGRLIADGLSGSFSQRFERQRWTRVVKRSGAKVD
jgi:tripartite-type tricarboxylate transporter receptor subunit TctC